MRNRSALFVRSVVLSALLVAAWVGSAFALEAGARAPEIGIKSSTGKPVQIAGLKGKVVIVDFWATWCGPCKEELPVLQRLYAKYKDQGLVVIGVSVDREASNAYSFAKKLKLTFPIVHDAEQQVAPRYKPPTMPSSYIVDRNGVVRHVHAGFRSGDAEKIEAEVKALLAAK